MNILTANIQREWLARILAGTKPIEYRDATDYWMNRLSRAGPPPFHLRLINGMKPDSPEATILVERVDVDLLSGSIRLHLGPIVSTLRWDPTWQALYPPIPTDPPVDPASLDATSMKPPKVTLKASPELVHQLQTPGSHQFTLPLNHTMCRRLNRQGPEPFLISISGDGASATVIVHALFWEPFVGEGRFSVVSQHLSGPSAGA